MCGVGRVCAPCSLSPSWTPLTYFLPLLPPGQWTPGHMWPLVQRISQGGVIALVITQFINSFT